MAVFTMASCDDIKESERLIEVPAPVVARTVLVEEFSGQACVNCPVAAQRLHDMVSQYGEEHFVVVTIHGGIMTWNRDNPADFGLYGEQCLGSDYAGQLDAANGSPNGKPYMVADRASGVKNDVEKWATVLDDALQRATPLQLEASTAYNDEKDEYTITVTGTADDNVNGKLQVWLTESGITAWQQIKTGFDLNFVHNNILREAVNGESGQPFAIKWSADGASAATSTCTLKLNSRYKAENCRIVAFVYNQSGVLQTVAVPLVPASEE